MSKYNGHKNWNHWNVSLWINNDEGLYTSARRYCRAYKNRVQAAMAMQQELANNGIDQTPDGAPYSVSAIKSAMVGM